MSLKDLKSKSDQALASIGAGAGTGEGRAARPVTAPGATAFMQPTIDALSDRAKRAEAKAALAERELAERPSEVALDRLVEVSSRKRRLTEEQFEELKANLANNALVHPVAVRRLADGRFEIVSGHNRVTVFRELGRSSIPVVVVDIEEAKVDRSSFYANLLQPSLPDYERYIWFRGERDRTGASQKTLAREAGVSEAVVSMLFAFEQLPVDALEAISRRPESIGMNCAAELARFVREGKGSAVVEAVQLLVEGKLTQKEAIAFASRRAPPTKPTAHSTEVGKIKAGRSDYCQYYACGSTLRIDFKNEALRAAAEEGVVEYLRTLADRQKPN